MKISKTVVASLVHVSIMVIEVDFNDTQSSKRILNRKVFFFDFFSPYLTWHYIPYKCGLIESLARCFVEAPKIFSSTISRKKASVGGKSYEVNRKPNYQSKFVEMG